YSVDQGEMALAGKPLSIRSPQHAQAEGISTVYQEVNLCPNLTVAENIFIGREPRRFGRIDWKTMKREASQLLRERLHLAIEFHVRLDRYVVALQHLVATARALVISAKVLILD